MRGCQSWLSPALDARPPTARMGLKTALPRGGGGHKRAPRSRSVRGGGGAGAGRGRNAHGLLRLTRPAPRVSPRGHRPRPSADNLLIGDRASLRVRGPLRCVMDGLALVPHHRAAQLAAQGLHSWLGQQRAGLKRVRPSGAACGRVSETQGAPGRASRSTARSTAGICTPGSPGPRCRGGTWMKASGAPRRGAALRSPTPAGLPGEALAAACGQA